MKKEKDNSKIFLISLIWKHLSQKKRNQLFLLFLLIILSGIAEIYSVASVIPFLNNLSNSESNYTISLIDPLYRLFSPFQSLNPIVFSTGIFLFCISIAAILRLINVYVANFISASIGS